MCVHVRVHVASTFTGRIYTCIVVVRPSLCTHVFGRGIKQTLWEGGMRGPGFVWSPLLVTSRYTSQHMIQVVDWLPTLLSAAGYNMTSLPSTLDGVDQWQALSHNTDSVSRRYLDFGCLFLVHNLLYTSYIK